MTAPRGHRVVTVERGEGYAARCEVERDGETHICDISFGGFATGSEARAVLVHEEAPGTVAPVTEGQAPREGTEMNTTTIAHSPELHESPRQHPPIQAFASDEYDEARRTGSLPSEVGATPDLSEREWTAANAELVEAARPRWADAERVVLDYHYREVESVGFAREVGDVVIEQWFTLEGNELKASQEPEIRILVDSVDSGVFTPDEAASISVSMMAAALMLGSDATVADLRTAAVAASLSPGQLYTAMSGSL
jgi:hypothetical protein